MKKLEFLRKVNVIDHELNMYGTMEEPLFLAVEVARMIDYSVGNTGQMLSSVDADEKILMITPYNVKSDPGKESTKESNKWFLTEDGLYEVLMQSRKPIARRFKRAIKDILKDLRLSGRADFEDWLNHGDPLVEEWETECKRREGTDYGDITFEEFLITYKGYTEDMF